MNKKGGALNNTPFLRASTSICTRGERAYNILIGKNPLPCAGDEIALPPPPPPPSRLPDRCAALVRTRLRRPAICPRFSQHLRPSA